jgi:hypothetical protein
MSLTPLFPRDISDSSSWTWRILAEFLVPWKLSHRRSSSLRGYFPRLGQRTADGRHHIQWHEPADNTPPIRRPQVHMGISKWEGCPRIWIDAIWIDQADFHNEKASQVSRMDTIYAEATKVIVWLGKSESNSDIAMESIPNLTTGLKSIENLDDVTFDNCHVYGLPKTYTEPVWDAVMELFDRPWCLRLWVMQDAILAKHLVFLCRTKSVWQSLLQDY